LGASVSVRARAIIGADGAASAVGRQAVPGAEHMPYVFAYHEIVRSPTGQPRRLRWLPL
jgi:geranylgeranyl reductase